MAELGDGRRPGTEGMDTETMRLSEVKVMVPE